MLDSRLFSPQSRDIAFNYDLLRIFSDVTGQPATVRSEDVNDRTWRKLVNGDYSIAVFHEGDTIPSGYRGRILSSVGLRDSFNWAVSYHNRRLLNDINLFLHEARRTGTIRDLEYRHFRSYRIDGYLENNLKANALSPYDEVVRKYGAFVDIDWRLLSAIIYQESRYNMASISNRAAMGLMQIKESTAAHYGIDDLYDPELNVKAGTLHFSHLVNQYRREGLDEDNVLMFALAAYNAGETRIQECRRVADSLGFNPDAWAGVEKAIGYMDHFNGTETTEYVRKVLSKYDEYRQIIE